MPPEPATAGTYFETPARAERLQLLLHLVRNAGDVIYLRAPSGAGKTAFAYRLLDEIADEMATVWLHAGQVDDVPGAAADQLGLDADQAEPWPEALLEALHGQELLLVVDDADQLDLAAFEQLAGMHARGGRLLLLGRGGLAQATGNWDVQFVDLPPFERQQTAAFLRGWAGGDAARITDDMAAALHLAARGLPGPLLEALNEVLAPTSHRKSGAASTESAVSATRRPVLLPWAAGAAVLGLLVAALAFQDQINALFEPAPALPKDSVAADRGGDAPTGVIERHLDLAPPSDMPADVEPAPVAEMVPPEPRTDAADSAVLPVPPPDVYSEPAPATSVDAESLTREPKIAESDPLEAVMRDALDAAEGVHPAEPTVPVAAATKSMPPQKSEPKSEPQPDPGQQPMVAPKPRSDTGEVRAGPPPLAEPEPKSEPAPETQPPVVVEARQSLPGADAARPDKIPAPVEERVAAPLQTKEKRVVAPSVAPPARTTAPVEAPRPVASGGTAWLNSRDPKRYTLQLVGARDRAAIEKFIQDHAVAAPYAVFQRMLNGTPWYSLVAGDYPDRAAAIAARERLPDGLERSGVWPRTFESIQKAM